MKTGHQLMLERKAAVREAALTLASRGPFNTRDLYRLLNPGVALEEVPHLGFKLAGLGKALSALVANAELAKTGTSYHLRSWSAQNEKPAAVASVVADSFIKPPTKEQLMAGRARPARRAA